MEEIKNRIAASGIITVDLIDYRPDDPVCIDLKDQLWQGLALKERDFRAWIADTDWSAYKDKTVCIFCSADAIVPDWAFMLVVSHLIPHTEAVYTGKPEDVLSERWKKRISEIADLNFENARVVLKGCGDDKVPESIFTEFLKLYQGKVKSIMYGEPCSTVPVYKQKKA